jgi:hypothetical protein
MKRVTIFYRESSTSQKMAIFMYIFLIKTKYMCDRSKIIRVLRGGVISKELLLAANRCRFDTHSGRRTIHARQPVQGPNVEYLSRAHVIVFT